MEEGRISRLGGLDGDGMQRLISDVSLFKLSPTQHKWKLSGLTHSSIEAKEVKVSGGRQLSSSTLYIPT
jgi:hypothetical protein